MILCKHGPVAPRCWGMALSAVCAAVLLCGGKGVGWAQFQVVGRDSPVCRSDGLDALLSSDVMPGAGT